MGRDSYKKDYMQIKGSKVTCKENEEWITINLDSNPNLLADSIYLLNKLLDEQDVLPRKDTEEKKEILKTSISERLVGDQKKNFLDWQEVTQAISEGNLTTRQKLMEVFHKKRLFSLEEKAKVCVLFQELINDIKDKKEKKFKEQFYANYSLNDNELSESIEVYHYLHPFENEKIAKSMNNIEQLFIDLVSPSSSTDKRRKMYDVVRASLILKRKLSSTQLKNDLLKRMVEPQVFSYEQPEFDTFMETIVNPYLKKNPATDPDYSRFPSENEQEQVELSLTNEVEPYYLFALKEVRKGFRKASTELFTHIYLQTTIEEKRDIIDGYAKQYLTKFDYLDFMFRIRQQHIQKKWNKNNSLQENFHLLLDGKSRTAYEERAYYLAYLEETTLPKSLKDTLKYLLLNELFSGEYRQVIELVPEKRQLLLLAKEIDIETVYEFESIQQGKKKVTYAYFLELYEKTNSKKVQEIITEQAKKHLTESKYVEFEIYTYFQEEFRRKSVTQPNVDFKEKVFRRFIEREDLSANDIRAFYLAYIDAQKFPNDIQVIIAESLTKNLTDKEKKEVITQSLEKKQLLLLGKYLGSDIVLELEAIQKGKKKGTDDYFLAIYKKSDSILVRAVIKEQAKKYLTESNYLEFDIKIQLQEESRKMDVTLPTVDFKDEALRYFVDHEVLSKNELIIYCLAYLESKEIPSDLETIRNLKKAVVTPSQIDVEDLVLEKKQLLSIANKIDPSVYEKLRANAGISIGVFTEMYENAKSNEHHQFINKQASLYLDAEKHLEFKKRIALYELSKSDELTSEVAFFIGLQRHYQQKNGENHRTKVSLQDIEELRKQNLSFLAKTKVLDQKSTEGIESKKNDEPKNVKEELKDFITLISRFDSNDSYTFIDSNLKAIFRYVRHYAHLRNQVYSIPQSVRTFNKLKHLRVPFIEENRSNWLFVLDLNDKKQSKYIKIIKQFILLPEWQSVAEIDPLFIAVKKRIEKKLERFSQEVEASQLKTDEEILAIAEKDPKVKELLTYYQKIAPAVPLKDFAKATPSVVDHFNNSAHQLAREYFGKDAELSQQIYELGKRDLPFCVDVIRYLLSTDNNAKAKGIPKSFDKESQERAEYIIENYHQKFIKPQQTKQSKKVLQKERKENQIANDTQLKELVRHGVFNYQKGEGKEIHIGQANVDSVSGNARLQQFIKELAEKLDTNRQREAAIQTVMKPNLSLEEREEFYAYLKNDPFLPLFLQKDNLSKLELKAYVDVCLKKTDLSFKGKISSCLRDYLTVTEKEKLNKLITEKEVIRAVAEEINLQIALEFERVINQNKQEIDPLVAVYRQTSFTPIKEFVLQHVYSSLTDENRSEFYQKIDSVAPINYLDQKKWEAPSTNKNVKQENDRFFSLIDEMKETLEQQKLVYYFPEIVKHILPPKIRNLEDIDKEYQITRERLEEIGIHFTDEQMQKWIYTFDEGPIVNDNYHISILKTIAKVIEENMERKGTLRENIPTDKAENNIVKEELIAAIEQSVVKINKDDSDKSVEKKFRDHLSNYPIILNLLKEQPEIGKKLLKKCQDRLPFVSLTSSKEFREIVDNEFAIRNTKIRKFARKHAPQVRNQATVEKQIYDLYQESPAWCCENLRAILVDYAGFKNINLNPIYRPELYSFQADGDSDKWRLLGKAQKIADFYTGIASDLKKILPKELQQKESVDKESQTEILTESTVSEHKKLNNMMDLTETDGKKRLFPTTDHFEPKSNLGQMKPLEKKCV
ncbi:hypothetical protein [Enterococcus hirae]|uniref:hypothetical protein n=1 Tax=Enterococcus hirae TaxID=1354 RepID=UPI001CBBC7B0|nr:hypothetical protein [Enterococcus hirae]MCL4597423.1 hypothetical protein [Enterococcus hirae]MCV3103422.1 hypothetical protein [Enterococcus hirae]MCV3108447.1 hypothetical protein [Enterococcus hirae]MCV3110984.1 hypothetical protein [Enterococcus hirae]MDT2622623.1 hypothetical protein [Enterococcus hirae]